MIENFFRFHIRKENDEKKRKREKEKTNEEMEIKIEREKRKKKIDRASLISEMKWKWTQSLAPKKQQHRQ